MNKRRDITLGLAATGIAVLGLISSIATANREHWFGTVALADQEALLILAAAFGVLIALKWWLAKRNQDPSGNREGSAPPSRRRADNNP